MSINKLLATGLAMAVLLTAWPGPAHSQVVSEAIQDLGYFLGTPLTSTSTRVVKSKGLLVGLAASPGAVDSPRDTFKHTEKICATVTLEEPGLRKHTLVAYWSNGHTLKESAINIFTKDKPEQVWSCLSPPRPKWAGKESWKVQLVLDGEKISEKIFWVTTEIK